MHSKTWPLKALSVTGMLAVLFPLVFGMVSEAAPAGWNDANFQLVWERTDKAVQDGLTARSWMWGPDTLPGSPGTEPYAEAPGGNRVVQYFDKSRMEVNDPAGDRSSLWFVTNGLLAKEMVSGKVQMGKATYTNKGASTEAVAGDPASANPNCPTYATFTGIASLATDHPAPPKTGAVVNEAIDKAGTISVVASPDPSVTYAYFDSNLKHNIPNKMWDFMNQSGLVYWNGGWNTEEVINWVFAMGFPITEAYWTKAKVGGVEKDVLVQLYERRVLTYTPSNPAGFQVEMGNVGQHYYRWRYSTPSAEQRIAFSSNRSGDLQIFSMKTTGGDVRQLTNTGVGISNMWPSWSPDNSKIVFESDRDGNWEVYVMNADGTNQQRLTFDAANSDDNPRWSPDGSRIIFDKDVDVYSMAANGGDVKLMTSFAGSHWSGVYSPDGTRFAWANSATGDDEVYVANVDGTGVTRLTYRPGGSDQPVDWNGGKILFASSGVGFNHIWSMDDDGGNQILVSADNSLRAAYSPDGSKVVVQKGDEIFIVDADGSSPINLTNSSSYDYQPDWSN